MFLLQGSQYFLHVILLISKTFIFFIRDARTILERNIKLQEKGDLDSDPNVYRGQAAYRTFVQKDATQIGMNKYTGYDAKRNYFFIINIIFFLLLRLNSNVFQDTRSYQSSRFCSKLCSF